MGADLADGFQQAVVDTLVGKAMRALQQNDRQRLVVAGGVAANRLLRDRLCDEISGIGGEVFYPRTEFCTDNGAMIAFTGLLHLEAKTVPDDLANMDLTVHARARWNLQEIS